MIRIAFEGFGDRDVVLFLQNNRSLALKGVHSFSQGEVINAVIRGTADAGIVDEDPNRSHHRGRDAMRQIARTADVDVLEMTDAARRKVYVLKPDLEGCYFAGLGRAKLKSSIADTPDELHRKLGQPKSRTHDAFRAELATLHDAAIARNCDCFTRDLEHLLSELMAGRNH